MENAKIEVLDLKDGRGRPLFRLLEDFRWMILPGAYVVVPKGYVTNFGSIPREMYWLVSPAELHEASIVHDYLVGEYFGGVRPSYVVSRSLADHLLFEGCKRIGLPWWKCYAVLAGVRGYALAVTIKRKLCRRNEP